MVVAEEASSSLEADDCRRGFARLAASDGVVGGGVLGVNALVVNSSRRWSGPKEEVAVENLPTYLMGAVLAWTAPVAAD